MRLAVGAALLAAFGRYAYLRLTVMPPRPMDRYYAGLCPERTPSADDVTAELLPVLLTLGQDITFNCPPPPKGMAWDWRQGGLPSSPDHPSVPPFGILDVLDTLNGDWGPATRPHLQAVMAHLELGLTRRELDELRAWRGRAWCYCTWAELSGQSGVVTHRKVRAAVKVLAADARYQHAQLHDTDAAWEDLKTGLWLADSLTPDSLISILVSAACQQYCLDELRNMTLERDISPALAADMDATLRAISPLADRWRSAVRGEAAAWQAGVDACFTRDADGNGWLDVTVQAPYLLAVNRWSAPTAPPCSRAWNLASVFYNDRRTVEAKLRRFVALLERVGTQPYADALSAFHGIEGHAAPFNVFDGRSFSAMTRISSRRAFQTVANGEASRRATRLIVALQRFKAEHGDYPDALAELVPGHIDTLPPDPFGAPSFTYRREGPDGYQLYSFGVNGKDDGGRPGTQRAGRMSEDGDQLFIYPRRAPAMEPTLVPVPETAQPAAPDTAPAENATRE